MGVVMKANEESHNYLVYNKLFFSLQCKFEFGAKIGLFNIASEASYVYN